MTWDGQAESAGRSRPSPSPQASAKHPRKRSYKHQGTTTYRVIDEFLEAINTAVVHPVDGLADLVIQRVIRRQHPVVVGEEPGHIVRLGVLEIVPPRPKPLVGLASFHHGPAIGPPLVKSQLHVRADGDGVEGAEVDSHERPRTEAARGEHVGDHTIARTHALRKRRVGRKARLEVPDHTGRNEIRSA